MWQTSLQQFWSKFGHFDHKHINLASATACRCMFHLKLSQKISKYQSDTWRNPVFVTPLKARWWNENFVRHVTVSHGWQINWNCSISYPLAYLKYLNKYALTTNGSTYVKYVNTFACQNYLHKIVVLHISVSGRQSRICRAKLSYVNSSDTQMDWHILQLEKHLWSMNIFKYAKG